MASPGVSILSAHPDSSIIVFVNVSSKTSSCSTRKQANDIHMVVEIFCRITLNSTVGDKRHPRLFSSQISPPHQSCLPRQRHMEIMRKKFRYERLLMNAVFWSSLKNAHLDFSSENWQSNINLSEFIVEWFIEFLMPFLHVNEMEKTLYHKKYAHFVTKRISKGEEVSRSHEGL